VRGNSLALVFVPLAQRLLDAREDEGVEVVDVREAIPNELRLGVRLRRLHVASESVERRPTAQSESDDLREEIGREAVVVASISGFTDAFGDPSLDETARLCADARFADAELLGEIVERAGLAVEDECAEEAAGDTRQAVVFGGESHPLDEGVVVNHGKAPKYLLRSV
jgi:hypothetical protein